MPLSALGYVMHNDCMLQKGQSRPLPGTVETEQQEINRVTDPNIDSRTDIYRHQAQHISAMMHTKAGLLI